MGAAIPVYIHLLRAKDLIDREYARPLDVPAIAREARAPVIKQRPVRCLTLAWVSAEAGHPK